MKSEPKHQNGYISAVNGSLIEIKGLENVVRLHDLIRISKFNILGEVIQIYSDYVIAQCYENTSGLKLKEEVINLGEPLSMELGPGLLSNIFDGIQRPLDRIYSFYQKDGFIKRGLEVKSLSRESKWEFSPYRKTGDNVHPGDIIGTVQETPLINHKILVPPGISGKIMSIAQKGEYTIKDEIYKLKLGEKEKSFTLLQKWPVFSKRPFTRKIQPQEPLITGLRVIDLLFPIVKGGTVAVPGGFGTGKTVIQQTLAKFCDADIIVFIGCGERGNEIADVLKQFSKIIDPKSGRPLIERIVIIANTSNMPVSAREASIFSGVTIAEYYRDMGYNVAVLADSTSRWAESLREISGLLEEMPAEEGYPAYLPSKLSSFYERAGVVELLGRDQKNHTLFGSITIIGSVSPPAGDFGEPVTANTKRFVQALWALDANLAYSKHYPAIDWFMSYSNYPDYLSDWWIERDIHWPELDYDWIQCRSLVNEILSKENELSNILQLVGEENLPEMDKFILFVGEIIREGFLIQSAFDSVDVFTDVNKLLSHIKIILLLYEEGKKLIQQGYFTEDIKNLNVIQKILRIKNNIENEEYKQIFNLKDQLIQEIDQLKLTSGSRK
ncbi:MAG: V-type ATP synthase subunit A [Promethearchaeota archaeon]|nr:MAG: V-type ATP synthase subunit A [Candidatus Lokiarchaeota archaeon]